MAPTHFFLIDVSYIAVSSSATAAACASVARVLDDLPGALRLLDRPFIIRGTFKTEPFRLPPCLNQLYPVCWRS